LSNILISQKGASTLIEDWPHNKRLQEVAYVFFKLGTIAFGGPAAHIAMMDDEIVKRRKWVTRETFMDLLGASNLIPGPNSTELAIHLGYKRAGWLGLLTAGICFITPAMLIVWLFAVLYQQYQTVPELTFILYGIKPVIIAIVLQALWGLGKTSLKSIPTAAVGVFVVLGYMIGWNEIMLLLISGLIVMLWTNRKRFLKPTDLSLWLPIPWLQVTEPSILVTHADKAIPLSLTSLFLTFLKIGSVLYGSGYVLLAFLQSNFVEHFGVLSSQQLLDAVAVGQFTPGPVFTTATFVGYLIQGNAGALLATLAIFLPAFVFVALISPWSAKLRKSVWISGFLDGVNAASLGLMAVVSLQLGKTALMDVWTYVLAILALFLLIRYKVNSVWLVMGGAIIGWIIHMNS
jgi:chromate transporter